MLLLQSFICLYVCSLVYLLVTRYITLSMSLLVKSFIHCCVIVMCVVMLFSCYCHVVMLLSCCCHVDVTLFSCVLIRYFPLAMRCYVLHQITLLPTAAISVTGGSKWLDSIPWYVISMYIKYNYPDLIYHPVYILHTL